MGARLFRHWTEAPTLHRFILEPHSTWLERQLAYEYLENTAQRWDTIVLRDFVNVYDEIIASCTDCLVSPHSIYDTVKRKRYIATDGITPSEGAIAAQYLRTILRAYAIPNLDFLPNRDLAMEEIPILPAYWDGKSHGNERLALVDISSAYWSILRWFPLDTLIESATVKPGSLYFLETEKLAQSKLVRNAIYGLTRTPSTTQHYRFGRKVDDDLKPQPFWNPYLSILTVSTMQSVANSCMAHLPIYSWLTDAAILNEKNAQELVDFLWESWKLRARIVESGRGRIKGFGYYEIGPETNRLVTRGKETGPVDTIDTTIEPEFWHMSRLFFYGQRPPKLLPSWPRGKWANEAEKTFPNPTEILFEKGRVY